MSLNFSFPGDFIKEVTTATTTGPIVLPNVAVSGFETFDSWWVDGNRVPYAVNDGNGNWEIGVGVYTAATHHISRDYIWWSTNGGAAVDFTGISAKVYSSPNAGGGNLAVQYHWMGQNNLAPTVTDDITHGNDIGSFWITNEGAVARIFQCVDPTTAAAIWPQLLTSNVKIQQPATMTTGGTTGAQTINKPAGSVNFAAGASSLVVTNNLVTASSIVLAVLRTNDATARIANVVPGSNTFTINLTAAATAETSCGFLVIN